MRITPSRFRQKSACLRCDQEGFTLTELAAVILIISILVSLLCSALNHTKNRALRITCLDNLKQLQTGWLMYAYDDNLPLNQTAPAPIHPRIVQNRSSTNSWVAGNPKEDVTTANIKRGTLFPYVRSVNAYRCPMDDSRVINRPQVLRTRSYAMNSYLGGDNIGVDPRFKTTLDELISPPPENVFVFVEEHESSIWASSFLVLPRDRITPASPVWLSIPSERHEQGCNITFADGHVEYWRWLSPKHSGGEQRLASARDVTDIRRLQGVIPAP